MQGLMIMLLACVAFLVAMIALAVARRPQIPRDASSLTRDAQRILDERLARGLAAFQQPPDQSGHGDCQQDQEAGRQQRPQQAEGVM